MKATVSLMEFARQHRSADELGYAWEMVVRAIHWGMLSEVELQNLINHLLRGQSYGSDEIMFEPWDGQLQVRLFDEVVHCPFAAIVRALQDLLDAYRSPAARSDAA